LRRKKGPPGGLSFWRGSDPPSPSWTFPGSADCGAAVFSLFKLPLFWRKLQLSGALLLLTGTNFFPFFPKPPTLPPPPPYSSFYDERVRPVRFILTAAIYLIMSFVRHAFSFLRLDLAVFREVLPAPSHSDTTRFISKVPYSVLIPPSPPFYLSSTVFQGSSVGLFLPPPLCRTPPLGLLMFLARIASLPYFVRMGDPLTPPLLFGHLFSLP